ncbi:MAG: hypothetical protein F6K19_41620 [Cyanothece sp. SIO1E1]|nr:hypothetical protein [Cyanothece sp. SIO1E1]
MIGNLNTALTMLIQSALPDLFGGAPPTVALRLSSEVFEVDPKSADAVASEPRPDDRTDRFPFNPDTSAGPYTLTQPPYPGPRRVWLVTSGGDRTTLRDDEILWDVINPQQFTLSLRPTRNLADFSEIEVLYGVTAIFTKLKILQRLNLQLESTNPAALEQAESLVVGVLNLNRQTLIDAAQITYESGDYNTNLDIKSLHLTKGTEPTVATRSLTLEAESELKATRALRDDEGQPIERIRTTSRPLVPERPIDIHIDVGV